MDNKDNTDPTDPLRTLENDETDDLFKSAFNGTAGVIKITSDSDWEPGQPSDPVCLHLQVRKVLIKILFFREVRPTQVRASLYQS